MDSFFPSFELRPSERHELLASWRVRRLGSRSGVQGLIDWLRLVFCGAGRRT